jgi:hypothetical protein
VTGPSGPPGPGQSQGQVRVPGPRPGPAATGSSRIDEALAVLADVRDAPPGEQVAPLTNAQRVLRETLDSIGDV